MIKVLIFDADGVIIGGVPFSKQLEKDYKISISQTKDFFQNDFQECLIGKKDLKKCIGPHLPKWGWEKGVDQFLDYWFKTDSKLNLKLVEYIKRIKQEGVKVHLATSQEKHRMNYLLKNLQLNKIFSQIFVSCDLGVKKPQKEFFENVMKKLPDIKSEEILFWDDKEEVVKAAKEFGWQAQVYKDFKSFQKQTNKC